MEAVYKFFAEDLLPTVKHHVVSRWQDIQNFAGSLCASIFNLFGEKKVDEKWYYYLRDSTIFQVAAIVFVGFCIYRLIYIPLFQDFIIAERCLFRLENSPPIKIGESVVYTISGFLPPAIMGPDEFTQKFFNALTAKVTLNEERIAAVKAYADDDYGRIQIIFTVGKSGTYKIDLRYNGFVIPGSPYELTVPPDVMSPSDSGVRFPSIPILLADGMPQTIEIFPMDRTGYPCSIEGVRLDKFDFHAATEKPCCEAALCGKVYEMVGGLWKEGLDASFTYEGSPVVSDSEQSDVLILLTIRTNNTPNSYGIFEGQICYDGHILKNGCFSIISLNGEEYERLEPIIKSPKPEDSVHLKGELVEAEEFVFQAPVEPGAEPVQRDTITEIPGASSAARKNNSKTLIEWYLPPKEGITGYTPITKEVYVNVCPECICIKEVEWAVILSRTAEFPIGQAKVVAVPETEEKLRYLVTISDANKNELRLIMSASNTRMFMALYLRFRATYIESASICGEII